MTETQYAPILELTRGDTIESVHFGALAVVDSAGRLLASYADPYLVTFMRSSAKPFQALPFVEAGGPAHYALSDRELAVMCASHAGTDSHVEVVSGIQARAGLTEADLMCGMHVPHDKQTANALVRRGEKPTANRHNCSGKHTGMLAFARMNGEPQESYLEIDHPVQQRIQQTLAEMCSLDVSEIQLGTDGCSAPNFALPLYHAAWGIARLVDPAGLPEGRAAACRQIVQAMVRAPEMISGPDRFDTRLMQAAGGRVIAKAGAEGYQVVGILPGALGPGSVGVGIALKISDGDAASRARPAVILEVLRQLGALDESALAAMAEFGPVCPIQNWRKLLVGEMRPVFKLN